MKLVLNAEFKPQFVNVNGVPVSAWTHLDEGGSCFVTDDIDVLRGLIRDHKCVPSKITDDGDDFEFLIYQAFRPFHDKHLDDIFSAISDGGYRFVGVRNGRCVFYREKVSEQQPAESDKRLKWIQ